mgnify:CR=1 FL=1
MSLSISALGGYDTFYPIYSVAPVNRVDAADRVGRDSRNIKTEPNDKVKKGECQTCAKRKYVDGSNEFNVSFKAPGHISPEDSAAKVMAHEQQHVANAIAEGSKPNKAHICNRIASHFRLSGMWPHLCIRWKHPYCHSYNKRYFQPLCKIAAAYESKFLCRTEF